MKIYLVLETPLSGGDTVLRTCTTVPQKALELARYFGRNVSPRKVIIKSVTDGRMYSAEEAADKRLVVYKAHKNVLGKWKERIHPDFEQEAKPLLV